MTTHARRSSSRRKAKHQAPAKPAVSDAAVYVALIMVAAFLAVLLWLLMQIPWTQSLVGFLIVIVVMTNLFGWQVYLGKRLQRWQEALARLPLRIAGYGTKGGKPLAAAKAQPDARITLMLFGAGSVLLVAVVSVLLIR